jgi:DNA-nicking Smr family endonuclease
MTKKTTLSDEDKRLFAEAMAASKPLTPKKKINETKKSQDTQSLAYRRYQASHTTPNTDTAPMVNAESALLFCRANVSDKQMQQLQQGIFPKLAVLDLHGLTENEAMARLNDFIYQSQKRKITVVLIIHGKGSRNSPNAPILKNAVNQQLRRLDAVLAFCSARAEDGGVGAVYTLLEKTKLC